MMKLVILMMLFPLVAFSQTITGVSGTVDHGASITILGSSFGTKETAEPLRYDDFEEGTISSNIAVGGFWDDTGDPPVFSDINQRYSGSNSARMLLTAGDAGVISYIHSSNLAIGDTIYVNFWTRIEEAALDQYQLKLWGMANEYEGGITYPAFGDFFWQYTSGTKSRYVQVYGTDFPAGNIVGSEGWGTPSTWINLSVEIYQGSVDVEDGSFLGYQDCVVHMDYPTRNFKTNTGDNLDSFKFGYYLGNSSDPATPTSIHTQFDDIYIDNTWARVEIGDASTWSACTHREIQIPTAWTATSVSVDVNTGSFVTDDTVYLYLVDADGNISNGQSLIIGESGGGDIPFTAPSNLTVTGGN